MQAVESLRSWVEVSRKQISDNFLAVKAAVGPGVEVMPVVKADAYRHGAVEVSRTLVAAGARWLAVSNVEEGVALRMAGLQCRILVMADFLPAERPALVEYNLTPVIHCLEDLAALDKLIPDGASAFPFHLKVDSGMGRLGVREDAARILEALSRCSRTRMEGLMTHFASAADYTSPQTDGQARLFHETCSRLAQGGVECSIRHSCSTIPIAYGRREVWHNMVRPGQCIYGYVSPVRGDAPEAVLKVKPALTWKAAVLAVKEVPEGALIGYGGMFKAARGMRIAVLAAGYADGIPHRLSNRGSVIVNGKLAPILGAVSMDLTTIDASHAPELKVGDAAMLIGSEGDVSLDAQQMARLAGTISYSILCGISARVRRIYL